MSLFPRPLVPDISLCSPPRPRDAGGPKAVNTRMAARKMTKPPAGRTPALPVHGKQMQVEQEIALLKNQLGEQRTEIGELKAMLKNHLGANVDDGTSGASTEPLARVTAVGCQASLPCPHCGKLVTDDAVQPAGIRGADNAANDQQPTPCTVSTSERQFVNEMIKVANKWLTNDHPDDIDRVSPPASSEVREVTSGQRAAEPAPAGNALDPFSTLFKNAEGGSSLSMQVNALAVRYLQNVGQQPSPHRGPAPRANPNWTVTRRQEVLTEELSINDIGEKGLGMRGLLKYQNAPANYAAACPTRYAPMPNHIPQCIPCHASHRPPEHDACCPYAPEHHRYDYGPSGKYVWRRT